MSEVMIVMMVAMLVAVFGFGHNQMKDGHGGESRKDMITICDQDRRANCERPSTVLDPARNADISPSVELTE